VQGLGQTAASRPRPEPPQVDLGEDRGAKVPPLRLATLQLGGCAGCHMSFLDADLQQLGLAARVRLVASPLGDGSGFHEAVDVCLVEGACSSEDDVSRLRVARARSRALVALGDCAGWGNVTALRDAVGGVGPALARGWGARRRDPSLPALFARVLPVPEVVSVDAFLPGYPPRAVDIVGCTVALAKGGPPAHAARAFG
jgi:NAD-reducing hydrogenase small subunit